MPEPEPNSSLVSAYKRAPKPVQSRTHRTRSGGRSPKSDISSSAAISPRTNPHRRQPLTGRIKRGRRSPGSAACHGCRSLARWRVPRDALARFQPHRGRHRPRPASLRDRHVRTIHSRGSPALLPPRFARSERTDRRTKVRWLMNAQGTQLRRSLPSGPSRHPCDRANARASTRAPAASSSQRRRAPFRGFRRYGPALRAGDGQS